MNFESRACSREPAARGRGSTLERWMMVSVNLIVVIVGGTFMFLGMQRVGGFARTWLFFGLSPYLALGATALLVHHGRFSPAARRSALATSVFITALSAFFQLPVLLHPGGCMDGLVVVYSDPLLVAIPVVHGLAYMWFRGQALARRPNR